MSLERRLQIMRSAVGVAAALLLALNVAIFGWGWQLVAGAPRESGYLLAQMLRATVHDPAAFDHPAQIQEELRAWAEHNPQALGAFVVDAKGQVIAAVPTALRGRHLPADVLTALHGGTGSASPLPAWVAAQLGASGDGAGYVARTRPLLGPGGTVLGDAVAVVPDVACAAWGSCAFVQVLRLNPLWLVLSWALLPTWVYLHALGQHRPRVALRWALVCLPLNLVGLALYFLWTLRASAAGWREFRRTRRVAARL